MTERDPAGGRRLVVLDIDDTLYLERDYVRSGFAAVGAWARDELGVDGLGDRAWAAFEAGMRRTIFDEALAASGVEADRRPGAPPGPGLPVARPDDRDADRRPGLARRPRPARGAGRGDRRAARQPAGQGRGAAAQPVGRPDRVHRDARPRPGQAAPGGVRAARARGGAAGDRCAYVADNPAKDFVAPHRLGWRTVRVRRPGGLHAEVPSGDDVDAEITGLDDLDTALAWRRQRHARPRDRNRGQRRDDRRRTRGASGR